MKKLALLLALAPAALLAQDFGTKKDLASAATKAPAGPAVQGMDIVQMLLALGLVAVILKWGLPKLLSKFNGWKPAVSKGGIILSESTTLGAGMIQIVEVRGRTLLVGATPTHINLIADLSVSAPVQEEEDPAFFELLDQEMDEPKAEDKPNPVFAVVEMEVEEEEEPDTMTVDDAARLLEEARKRRARKSENANPYDDIKRLLG